MIRYTYCS